MDTAEFTAKLADLSENIDDLENALQPLLTQDLSELTSKLPLLDKAKINVLSAYAIESLLFSILKLHGTNAKSHPVFTELARVKQYFMKLEAAESQNGRGNKETPNMTLDKAAANRFIKNALSANNPQRGPQNPTKIVFDDMENGPKSAVPSNAAQSSKKRKAVPNAKDTSSSSSSSSDSTSNTESSPKAKLDSQKQSGDEKKQSERKEETSAHSKPSKATKIKSSNPPRDSSAVFQDLLTRPKKRAK